MKSAGSRLVPRTLPARQAAERVLAERALVVCFADWPVAALAVTRSQPAVVLYANRVVASSLAARRQGVETGLRRRDAQARCPDALVLAPDPAREARAFEPVVAALEALTPRIEVLVSGRATFATRGPSRYFGGDQKLARLTEAVVTEALSAQALDTTVGVGVADGAFAAGLAAASLTGGQATKVVAPGDSASFLAPLSIVTLGPVLDGGPALVDVWSRLGLVTLGDLAAIGSADVLARFGSAGAMGHRLATGADVYPIDASRPGPEYTVAAELDPPAERVDTAAFVAKGLADRLHGRLAADGRACTRVVIVAETEHGERLERVWRHEGTLSAGAIAERTRWQLDGWLSGGATGRGATVERPTAGISRLVLIPDGVVAASGRQLGFWGGESRVDDRVVRALARIQGLLGVEAVRVPEHRGGRGPGERVTTVPVASVDLTESRSRALPGAVTEPWPGQIPAPAPAVVHEPPLPAVMLDRAGSPVGVSARATVTGAPARLSIDGGAWQQVESWAGPWPVDERWWDPAAHRRCARFQVVTDTGSAHLLSLEHGQWGLEATYC